jgi:hypothetical protein
MTTGPVDRVILFAAELTGMITPATGVPGIDRAPNGCTFPA